MTTTWQKSKTREIGRFTVNKPYVSSATDYPVDETLGNFHAGAVREMSINFLKANHAIFDESVEIGMDRAKHSNADRLTAGKQTWDPLTERSVPSATAYAEMNKLFDVNGLGKPHTCLGWIKSFMVMMNKDTIVTKKVRVRIVKTKNKIKGGQSSRCEGKRQ